MQEPIELYPLTHASVIIKIQNLELGWWAYWRINFLWTHCLYSSAFRHVVPNWLEWLHSQKHNFLQQAAFLLLSWNSCVPCCWGNPLLSFLWILPHTHPLTYICQHWATLRCVRWAISYDLMTTITVRFYKMKFHLMVKVDFCIETTEGNVTAFSIQLSKHLQFKAGETIM